MLLLCRAKKGQSAEEGKCHPEATDCCATQTLSLQAVKKYLREHGDYTYTGLQESLPKALESVQLSTIRKWEHHMIQWMDAYREGKGA